MGKSKDVKATKPKSVPTKAAEAVKVAAAKVIEKPAAKTAKMAREITKKAATNGKESKKSKKVESSSESEESDEESAAESSDDASSDSGSASESGSGSDASSDSESDEEMADAMPKVINGKAKVAAATDDSSDSSDSSGEEEQAKPTKAAKATNGVNGKSKKEVKPESEDSVSPFLYPFSFLKQPVDTVQSEGEEGDDDESSASDSEDDSDDSESDSEVESADEEVKAEAPSKKRKSNDEETAATTKKTKTEATDEGSEKSATLWIGNLGWGVDDNVLYEEFKSIGGLVGARVVTDKESGRSRGFGYIDFSTPEAAEKAFNEKNGSLLEGRDMRLDFAAKPAAGNTPNARAADRARKHGDTVSAESDTLFVGNLSFNVTEETVSAFFNEIAAVQSLRLPTEQ